MLASMSKIHPGVDVVPVDWSADGVSELVPTGTVTLLLADIEGATPTCRGLSLTRRRSPNWTER